MQLDYIVNDFFVALDLKYPILLNIFYTITDLGAFPFILVASIVVACLLFVLYNLTGKKHYFAKLLVFVFAMVSSTSITYYLKIFFSRAGPYGRTFFEIDYSFPSGHATAAFVFFGILYFVFKDHFNSIHRKIFLAVTVLVILLVGLSRLILNVHYLSDVLVGYLIALACILISTYLYKKLC